MSEKLLEIKDEKLSFFTPAGEVKALNGVSFSMNEGEVLGIVGESGSGKSVTAKSIIGINAANAIVESGEIIYKGEDLLKYTEEEMGRIRGNDLTMVFQDPLSSLDPIMKVGKQMTEATLLNNRTRRKNAKGELKRLRKSLTACMKRAGCTDTQLSPENVARALRASGDAARAAKRQAVEAVCGALPLFEAQTLQEKEARETAKRLIRLVEASIDPLELYRNSCACTFGNSMNVNLDRYFAGQKNNPREERRVARETQRRRRAGKGAAKVVPANLVDLTLTRRNLCKAMTDLLDSYCKELAAGEERDYAALAGAMLGHLERKQKEAQTKVTKQEAYDRAIGIMRDVGIKEPERRFNQYPHEFSGGMRQRIVIAIVMNPELIIADEPVSALDVSIQAQVINLLNELREEMKLTILFIAHDLSVVKYFSDRIIVMYFGKIVEIAEADELFAHPLHPYTQSPLSAIPLPDPHYERQRRRTVYVPGGAKDGEQPELREVAPGHLVSCTKAEREACRRKLGRA